MSIEARKNVAMIVSIVLVNYNGAELLGDCLSAIEAQTQPADEVVVIDNGSSDGSVAFLRRSFPWVHVYDAGTNLGFAAGANLGIRRSTGDIVILLNNDTTPGPSFVESLVEKLEEDESISAVAGVLLFSDAPDIVASAGIDVFRNGLALDRDVGVAWREMPSHAEAFGASAGAAAFRRSSLVDTDLFPEPFFLYLEDVDLAWRLQLRGHRTVVEPRAWALHVYSASSVEGSSFKDYFLARNRMWTLVRCWPARFWLRNWPYVAAYELGAIAWGLLNGRWASVRGRIDAFLSLRRLLHSRRIVQSRSTVHPEELIYWLRSGQSVRGLFRVRRIVRELTRRSS
jgi:GT2 family glycosyltransferase